jgi:predicted DNA-binding protein
MVNSDRGRPKIKDSERKTKSFTICLKLDTYKKLKKLAEENRQPTSTMVRLIVEDAVEKVK